MAVIEYEEHAGATATVAIAASARYRPVVLLHAAPGAALRRVAGDEPVERPIEDADLLAYGHANTRPVEPDEFVD